MNTTGTNVTKCPVLSHAKELISLDSSLGLPITLFGAATNLAILLAFATHPDNPPIPLAHRSRERQMPVRQDLFDGGARPAATPQRQMQMRDHVAARHGGQPQRMSSVNRMLWAASAMRTSWPDNATSAIGPAPRSART